MDERQVKELAQSVEGRCSEEECWRLFRLLREVPVEGDAVEIGNFKGRITVCLGKAMQERGKGKLYSIDSNLWGGRQDLVANVERAGVAPWVTLVFHHSASVNRSWRQPLAFLWVDTDITYTTVYSDFVLWERFLKEGGVIAFSGAPTPAMQRIKRELLEGSGRFSGIGVDHSVLFAVKQTPTPRYSFWFLWRVRTSYAAYYWVHRNFFALMRRVFPRYLDRDFALKRAAHRLFERMVG